MRPSAFGERSRLATYKGLFGGSANLALVREAAKIVPAAWRESDPEKSVRFFAPLLSDTGLMKITLDDLLKTPDLRILGELKTELKK